MLKKIENDNKNLTIVLITIVSILLGIFVGYNMGKNTNITQNIRFDTLDKKELKEHKININKATYEELKIIDGIGEVKAKKVIENRPYNNIHDLLKKNVIGEDLFNKLKGKLVV